MLLPGGFGCHHMFHDKSPADSTGGGVTDWRLVCRSVERQLSRAICPVCLPSPSAVKACGKLMPHWCGTSCLQVIGETAVPLDGRFSCVRSRESNLANLCCDALREACR